jgi:hypothetical protein
MEIQYSASQSSPNNVLINSEPIPCAESLTNSEQSPSDKLLINSQQIPGAQLFTNSEQTPSGEFINPEQTSGAQLFTSSQQIPSGEFINPEQTSSAQLFTNSEQTPSDEFINLEQTSGAQLFKNSEQTESIQLLMKCQQIPGGKPPNTSISIYKAPSPSIGNLSSDFKSMEAVIVQEVPNDYLTNGIVPIFNEQVIPKIDPSSTVDKFTLPVGPSCIAEDFSMSGVKITTHIDSTTNKGCECIPSTYISSSTDMIMNQQLECTDDQVKVFRINIDTYLALNKNILFFILIDF